jgi:hypothetical protein
MALDLDVVIDFKYLDSQRVKYANYNYIDDEMNLFNFNSLLNRYIRGEVIIAEEEKRVLCDFISFANDDEELEDVRMCKIDKGLIDA